MPLEKARHVRYWQRCRSTLLPAHYTPHDSTRMTLAFFIISALDLLSTPSEPLLSADDKRDIRSWVLSLQHPAGGFVGSPSHLLPKEHYLAGDGAGAGVDANLAATFFALLLLAIADEGEGEGCAFAGVDRRLTLAWLKRLQRKDGSFGEVVDGQGMVSGGRDMRYCYLAAGIRWCLRGDVEEGSEAWVEDIDVAGLVAHIRRAQTYDGGMGESSQHESHAGYAYCAIAALSLLERPLAESATPPPHVMESGIPDVSALVKFLVGRQLAYVDPPESDDDDEEEEEEEAKCLEVGLGKMGLGEFVGYNGRWNKKADTCYCWWAGATLKILGHDNLISNAPSRAFLLEKTQHIVGGFGKHPGSSPDAYHAYLGLAALATLGDEELGGFDAGLCVAEGVAARIERGRAVLVRSRGGE